MKNGEIETFAMAYGAKPVQRPFRAPNANAVGVLAERKRYM